MFKFSISFLHNKCLPFYFLKAPANKHIQPDTNDSPPKGVIIPIHLPEGISAACNQVRMYNEPLNKIIPVINNMPAHLTNVFVKSLYNIAATKVQTHDRTGI